MATFLDSNILVYVADQRDSDKHAIASDILDAVLDKTIEGRLSVQTLVEFSNVALKKLHLEIDLVKEYVDVFKTIDTIAQDAEMVNEGLEIKRRYGIQFYGAMMVAAAMRLGCSEILSEDLSDGQTYFTVTARNPFKGVNSL